MIIERYIFLPLNHASLPNSSLTERPLITPKQTLRTLIPTRINATINRLEKTRTIRPADELPAAKEAYLTQQRSERRREAEKKRKEEERIGRERREEKERRDRGYDDLDDEGLKKSNEEGFDEDDFM